MVRRSRGGNTSHSSWYVLPLVKDGLRDSASGVGGVEEASGVLIPSSGEPPLVEDVDDSFVDTRAIPGERLSLDIIASGLGLSRFSGSDMV